MINNAIAAYQSAITSLGWVENYGGLTKLVRNSKDQEVQYPVSQYVNFEQCWNGGVFKKLVPDDSINSLLYYEQLNNTSTSFFEANGISRRIKQYLTDARLIVWVNLNKMGLEQTTDASAFVNDLMKVYDIDKTGDGARYETQVLAVENFETTRGVFEKYNYSNIDKLLYYPYMAITMTIRFKQIGDLNCYASTETFENIECKNYAYS